MFISFSISVDRRLLSLVSSLCPKLISFLFIIFFFFLRFIFGFSPFSLTTKKRLLSGPHRHGAISFRVPVVGHLFGTKESSARWYGAPMTYARVPQTNWYLTHWKIFRQFSVRLGRHGAISFRVPVVGHLFGTKESSARWYGAPMTYARIPRTIWYSDALEDLWRVDRPIFHVGLRFRCRQVVLPSVALAHPWSPGLAPQNKPGSSPPATTRRAHRTLTPPSDILSMTTRTVLRGDSSD